MRTSPAIDAEEHAFVLGSRIEASRPMTSAREERLLKSRAGAKLTALAGARRARRRELALVKRHLTQIRRGEEPRFGALRATGRPE